MTNQEKGNVIDWLNEIITNPEWQMFYSDSEIKTLAKNALRMLSCENCRYAEPTDIDGLIYCKKDGHTKDEDMVCEKFVMH